MPTYSHWHKTGKYHPQLFFDHQQETAGLEDSLIPENWDFYLLSKLIYIQLPFRTSHPYRKKKKVIRRMKCFTSMSVEGNTTTYSASNTTLNTESRMSCTTYKKQTYLNNLPPPILILWFSLKRVIWQHFFPFMGKKKEKGSQHPSGTALPHESRSSELYCYSPIPTSVH